MRTLYLIDGVAQPRRVWEAKQLWGEYAGADFTVVEINSQGREVRPRQRGR